MFLVIGHDRAQYDRVRPELPGPSRYVGDAVELAQAITQDRVGKPKRRDYAHAAPVGVEVLFLTGWLAAPGRTNRHVGGIYSTITATSVPWRYQQDETMLTPSTEVSP